MPFEQPREEKRKKQQTICTMKYMSIRNRRTRNEQREKYKKKIAKQARMWQANNFGTDACVNRTSNTRNIYTRNKNVHKVKVAGTGLDLAKIPWGRHQHNTTHTTSAFPTYQKWSLNTRIRNTNLTSESESESSEGKVRTWTKGLAEKWQNVQRIQTFHNGIVVYFVGCLIGWRNANRAQSASGVCTRANERSEERKKNNDIERKKKAKGNVFGVQWPWSRGCCCYSSELEITKSLLIGHATQDVICVY